MVKPEVRFLKLFFLDELRESPVRQEETVCQKCETKINLLDDNIEVAFKEIQFGGKTYTLLEPFCPFCEEKVDARYHVVQ